MDNVWERLAQLHMRDIGSEFADVCKNDNHNFQSTRKNCRLKEPSILDRQKQEGPEDKEDELDSKIWRNLPESILEVIFQFLPLHALLRFRAVCKQWNAFLRCRMFLQCWHYGPTVRQESPWLIFRGSVRECVAYNPSIDRWSIVPLSFLPSQRVRVVASAGGLLCLRRRDDSLTVYNPFTKSYLQLTPKFSKWKYPIIGMVAYQNNEKKEFSYKIIVSGSHEVPTTNMTTEVYCSNTQSWKVVGSRPVPHHFQVNVVHHDGFLYSAAFSVVMVYNLKDETWTEMAGPPMTQHTNLVMPQICECRGQLLMVEMVSERFVMRQVYIWANDRRHGGGDENHMWVMLDKMPEDLLGEVVAMSNNRFFTYFGHDDLLCFVIARCEILAYTVSQRTWRWLPSCPYVQGFAQRFAAFAYHPTLEDP